MSRVDYWRHLFKTEPTLRILSVHSWDKAIELGVVHRSVFAILVSYFPLTLLAVLQNVVFQDGTMESFLQDFGVISRFVIAVPFFLLSPTVSRALDRLPGILWRRDL